MAKARKDKTPLVVCMGEALVDFIAEETVSDVGRAGRFIKAPGGAVANTAVGLARLGVSCRFIGMTGADPFGRFLREHLAGEGVDVSFLSLSERWPTGLVFVSLNEERVPSFCFFGDPSADMMFPAEEVKPEMLRDADWLHVGTVSMAGEVSRLATFKLMETAREQGVKVSFDPNLRLHLWKDHEFLKKLALESVRVSSLVKLNLEELFFLTGEESLEEAAGVLLGLGPEAVVVTLGPEGAAYFRGAGGSGKVPGFSIHPRDTTGAGDGFAAGLLAALMRKGEWPPSAAALADAVRFANAVAAMTCLEFGAQAGLPRLEQVSSFLAERGEV